HIKDAAKQALDEGKTKYTPAPGTVELRRAIGDDLKRSHGLSYGVDEIIVSCGGKHACYNVAQALFEAGDEVLIPAPFWVSYPDIVALSGATPVIVPTMPPSFSL